MLLKSMLSIQCHVSFDIVNFPHMSSNIPSKPAYRRNSSPKVRVYIIIHIAIFYTLAVLGPAIGYMLGGVFLSIYVDPACYKPTWNPVIQAGWEPGGCATFSVGLYCWSSQFRTSATQVFLPTAKRFVWRRGTGDRERRSQV